MSAIFQVSGPLLPRQKAFVKRQADQDALYAALQGEYLHVIAARQLGKTSLLRHLATGLAEKGWRCAYIDVSILMDLHKLQWYDAFGKELASTLTPGHLPSLTNQIDLHHYLLDMALPWPTGRPNIAVLLDEVEGVGKAQDTDGAPFSDTFFMTLRSIYNRRHAYEGTIVVALAGAVSPNDLVKDPAISPFNVGQEVSLDDFTATETETLTRHLDELKLPVDERVHQTIYKWTNGHPYLTQRICAELEKASRIGSSTAITPDHVDTIVEQIILNPADPLQRDKNLGHITRRLNSLSAPAREIWSYLQTVGSVSRKAVAEELFLELFLTGIAKAQADEVVVRNRIYERAFIDRNRTLESASVGPKPGNIKIADPIRIFISSTWQDLQNEREAVEKALHRMRDAAFAGMEYFGSHHKSPLAVSMAEVDRCGIYIGIFAHRYGSGITEAEYRQALDRGLHCLIYLKDESVLILPTHVEQDPKKIAKLEALKRELQDRHAVCSFTSPDHLATLVVADLHNLLGSASLAGGAE